MHRDQEPIFCDSNTALLSSAALLPIKYIKLKRIVHWSGIVFHHFYEQFKQAEKILDSLEGGCLSGMRAEEGELLQQDFGFDVEEHTDLGIKSELC